MKAATRQQHLQEIEAQSPRQVAAAALYPEHTVQERAGWRSYLPVAGKVLGIAGLVAIAYMVERARLDDDGIIYYYDDYDDSDDETISTLDAVDTYLEEDPEEGSDRRVSGASTSALPRGRMRDTDKTKGKDSLIPNAPGLYQHINKATREVEYVGQTNNLRIRQQQHVSSGKLDTERQFVRWGTAKETATKDDLCQTEMAHIARHSPRGNTTKGGNGRR